MKAKYQKELKIAEEKGLVADSLQVRIKLLEEVKNGEKTLEEMQEKLKKIQKEAHKNYMYERNDFFKTDLISFEVIMKKSKQALYTKLSKKLPINKNVKETRKKV